MSFDCPVTLLVPSPIRQEPPKQPPESTPKKSWFAVVKEALNPTAFFFSESQKQPEGIDLMDIKPPSLITDSLPLDYQKIQDAFANMAPPPVACAKKKEPLKAPLSPSVQAVHPTPSLDIPSATTTPVRQIAEIPETTPEPQILPSPQANTPLDIANNVATKVGAVATVTGTLAKGVDWLPGGAGVKQQALGKIHALYQGIKFPSLSLGKVYQGAKSLYQMASLIKSSELIGAAIVCGGLYWWFKRPHGTGLGASGVQTPVVINVNINNANHNSNNNNATPEPQVEK